MLTFREVQNCEGYYYDTRTADVLRNVGPGETRCWSGGNWCETGVTDEPNDPRFELLTPDVLLPFAEVERLASARHGGVVPGGW